MATAAILPVKRFDLAKQRLHAHLDSHSRALLASAMVSDVVAVLERVRALDSILLVSAEPALERLVDGSRVQLVPDVEERGQSAAALEGIARAAELALDRALLVPGDCPLIDAFEIEDLIEQSARLDVTIVPDRHRSGTNALALSLGGATDRSFEPRFGPESLTRHLEQAMELGLRHSQLPVPSLALDVDTPDDLAELVAVLQRTPELAPATRAALRELERASRLPSPA